MNVCWSRGNGWAAAAFAKVLRTLPATRTQEYRDRLTEMAAALRAVQRSDGFLYAGTEVAARAG
ncbi:hypothetical protein GCM10027176_58330 [Actinoallomurus bryophytorum]|uniref:glycoside hydrolase family 88 protein n=1 Tax=Actinoallomurus bryophytorum TaxID=1490222 RepID=UPI00115312E3|nr:glycoside hydrolase family 88 protein [Actinoallomurus bryophytorum]